MRTLRWLPLLLIAGAATAQLRPFPEDLPSRYGVVGLRVQAVDDTLRVIKVRLGSPARKAGLQVGDRLLGADGISLATADELSRWVQSRAPDDSVRFHVIRGSQPLDVTCQVTDRRRLYALMDEGGPRVGQPHHDTTRSTADPDALALVHRHNAGGVVDSLAQALGSEMGRYGDVGRVADVDYLMRHPLKTADAARTVAGQMKAPRRIVDVLRAAAERLDVSIGSTPRPLDGMTAESLLVGPLQRAAGWVDTALADLTDDEVRDLRKGADHLLDRFDRSLYLDEGDSVETTQHVGTMRRARRVDLASLVRAAIELARLDDAVVLERLAMLRDSYPAIDAPPPGFEGDLLYAEKSPWGWIIVADTTDNVHGPSAAVLIDLGGDDIYLPAASPEAGISLLIDVAGDDQYIGNHPGSLGSAVAGISLLIDRQGNDDYSGDRLTQGAAFAGIGILRDASGDDVYRAQHASQGAGFYGIGCLLDEEGDDLFHLGQVGQGLGGARGLGLLRDGGGNDRYVADYKAPSSYGTQGVYRGWAQGVGVGFRGFEPGGWGLLLSQGSDDDTYQAGNFAQGTGYFFGIGLLSEEGGNDRYLGSRYSQGAAAHQAIGVLLDDGGHDRYHGSVGANQAAAWDAAIAVLIDAGGDDEYTGGGLSQGASAMNGVGWLHDQAGNDRYSTLSGQGNGGSIRYWGGRGALNLGLLLDEGAGVDTYTRKGRANGATLRDSRVGLFVDR